MNELNDWDYALDNMNKKRRQQAQDFLDRVGYDFDENKLDLRDSLAYDFVKPEADELIREHNIAANSSRGLSNPYDDVRDNLGSYPLASNTMGVDRHSSKFTDEDILKNMGEYLASASSEGFKEHIYLDSKGKRTTGIGNNIDKYDEFMAVDWRINGKSASKQEKEKAYYLFEEMKERKEYGFKAEYYEKLSPLRIAKEYAIERMQKHLRDDLRALRNGIKEFDDFPDALKEVLLDFRYNTGNITREYHSRLREALDYKDLSLIEKWIMRPEIQKERRDWILQKLQSVPEVGGWHRSKR